MQEQSVTYFESNRPVETLLPTIKALVKSPRVFFANVPLAYYHRDGMFFASIVIFAMTFISMPFYGVLFLFLFPITWGVALVSLRLWAAYLAWSVRVFGKKKLSSKQAFQLSAYTTLPMVFALVPVLGLIASLWNLYLLWIALSAYCKLSSGTAFAVIFVPVIVLLLSSAVLVALLVTSVPQLAAILS